MRGEHYRTIQQHQKRGGGPRHGKGSLRSALGSKRKNKTRHKKDFGWRKPPLNPYTIFDSREPSRVQISLFLIFSSFVLIILLFLFHPFFAIKHISVVGLQRIETTVFEDAVDGMLEHKRFFLLPSRNYPMVNVANIKSILLGRFPLEELSVEKEFPDSLAIVAQEKISTVIYDTGTHYSYLGLDGVTIEILRQVGVDEWRETIVTSSTTLADGTVREESIVTSRYHVPGVRNLVAEMGDYPILYNPHETETEPANVALPPTTVQGAIAWFKNLRKMTDIPFSYMELAKSEDQATIHTFEGWSIRVSLTERISEQFEDLLFILREKVSRERLQYIDLRYPDKIFWL
jgi:hypothetical protein